MKYENKGLQARPDLMKKEKIGIAIIVLIAVVEAAAIYYFLSLNNLKTHELLAGLSGWTQEYIVCSESWVKASIKYTDRIHLIYFLAVCSVVFSCGVVITTTPRRQLLLWSENADARRVLFHLFVYVIGLLSILCHVGNYFAIGDMRESSRFLFLFNSYIGFVLLICVALNAFAYYAAISLLLFVVRLRAE